MPDVICRDEILKSDNIYSKLGSLVLDIGCATGYSMSKVQTSVGLDLSPQNLLVAKELLPQDSFVLAEASCLPFRNNVFSGEIAMEIMEHANNPISAVYEYHRCLKSKGICLITFDIFSISRTLVSYFTSNFIVNESLWHKKSVLSDSRDWITIDKRKLLAVLSLYFNIIEVRNIRGLLTNFINTISIIVEKTLRPKELAQGDIGAQSSRVNNPSIKIYIKFILPIVRSACKIDPFRWDASGIMVLAEKN
jgi:ubiquinone/menaquinone biosynthesis C-methylase UbiE